MKSIYIILTNSLKFIFFVIFTLLFNVSLKAQTLTVTNSISNLTNLYTGGNTNIAVMGFTISPSSTVKLGTVVVSHNATSAANLNGSFTDFRIGTCTSAAFTFASFTNIDAATATVNSDNITFSALSLDLSERTTNYFFIVANVNSFFTAGFPLRTAFSLNNAVTTTFKNNFGEDFVTNAYLQIPNILLPNLARAEGTAFYWNNIPNATQNTDATKTLADANIIDGNTTINVSPPSDVSMRLNYQAAGITWPTTKNNIGQLKFYNSDFNSFSHTDNNYFHDSVRVQYATDALATNWSDATGWASNPFYPTNRFGNNSGANGVTFTFTGPQLNGVTGLRVIGQLRTDTVSDLYSYALGVREIEIFPVSVYYFKPAETVVTTLTNWGVNEDGTGTAPTSFIEPSQFYFRSNETLNSNITSSAQTTFSIGASLDAGVTLTMGTNTISNATVNIPLAITSGSNTLQLAGAVTPILGILSQGELGSTVQYNGGVQNVGIYNYNNLTINNDGIKTLSGNTTVNRTLTISNSGNPQLAIGANTLTLNGIVTGLNTNQRNIIANGFSNLVIGGTGALGTLFFDQTIPGKSFGTSNTDFVPLSIGSTNRLNNFTINRTSGGSVILGNELQITNLLTPTAGTLTTGDNLVMLSTDATTSSILALNSASDISGNVNVQSFFKGGTVAANRGFRMIASPTANTGTFFAQLRERFILTCDPATGSGCDFRPLRSPNAQTLTNYNEPGLTAGAASFNPINHASTMQIGRGYYFFFRGNRSNLNAITSGKINEPFSLPEDWTATYIGAINKGDIVVPVTKTTTTANTPMDGLNLIGNPYPAVLNFNSFQSDASNSSIIDPFLMIMKRDRTGFITYSGGVLTAGTISAVQSAGGTTAEYPFLQPGQGFFVRKKDPVGAANVTFKETHKAAAADSQKALRTLEAKQKSLVTSDIDNNATIKMNPVYPAVRQLIRFNIKSGENQDDAVIVLEDGNSANYGGNDAPYMANNSIFTYSLTADSVPSSINFMPSITNVKDIKLFVEATKTDANLKLNFTDLVGAGKNELWLKDNFKQTNTLITVSNNSYNFGIDKSIKTTSGKDRFSLFFVPKIVYEINLNNFTATANNIGIQLEWETKTEINSSKFELQRSADGVTFETIHNQVTKAVGGKSSETLTYSFLDKTSQIGTVYYRLKMVVKDATSTISEIKTVEFSFSDKNTVIIYPTPIKDELNISWKSKNKENLSLAIYDVSGKMVLMYKDIKGQNFTSNVANLNAGIYIIKLKGQTTNSQIALSKFIKN